MFHLFTYNDYRFYCKCFHCHEFHYDQFSLYIIPVFREKTYTVKLNIKNASSFVRWVQKVNYQNVVYYIINPIFHGL